MKLIIHDLEEEKFREIFKIKENENIKIINKDKKLKNCLGCFHCWIKTPRMCVIKDGYENLGILFSKVEEIMIVSKCCYGGYSPFIKNILDRSLGYISPFFKIKNNEMHHKSRYKNKIFFTVYFYNKNMTKDERKIAKEIVKANTINYNGKAYNINFLNI